MDSLLFSYYNALVAIAVFVLFIYGEIIYRKIKGRSFDLIFDFALGVFLICLGTVMNRSFFSTRRFLTDAGYDVAFLQHHPVLFVIFLPLLIGYLWHIHTMTKEKYKWKVLVFAFSCAIATFCFSLYLF